MSMFGQIAAGEAVEPEEEKLGGGGGYVSETGVYDFVVEMAYGGQSSGGAYFLDLKLKTEDGLRMNMREYITSGTAKGIRPYYIDKKSGAKKPLPGYAKMNALDIILTGNPAEYPVTETKTINLWNKEAEKELPTQAEVVTSWVGKPVSALVRIVREFKQAKNGAGDYVDTADTRDSAEIIHFVDAVTGQTRSEKMAGKEATIKGQFEGKYDSTFVYDKTKGKGKPAGAPAAAAETPASPFGNK